MAPGLDGLPAAEREIDVSGPVAEFLRSVSPRALTRIKLGLRAFEWLPFPWRFSRLDPAAREDFLRGMEASRFGLHHELLLMAKVFATLGSAIAPRGRGADRLHDELPARGRSRCPSPPAHLAKPRPSAKARNATSSSSAPERAVPLPPRPWPRPAST